MAEGNKMIAEGWAMFNNVVGQAGMGELPQLLRSVRRSMTPVIQVKEEVKMEEESKAEEDVGEASGSRGMTITPVREGGPKSLITIQVKTEGGKYLININAPSAKLLRCQKGGWTATLGRSIH